MLKIKLPDIQPKLNNQIEIEKILLELKNIIETKYDNAISVYIRSSYVYNEDDKETLYYALYLTFNKINFSYRLIEINCYNNEGDYPIIVNAFSDSSEYIGIAETNNEFCNLISKIFDKERTHKLILSLIK